MVTVGLLLDILWSYIISDIVMPQCVVLLLQYEDFVPDHLETKLGGFYINTGELEFRTAEDIE